MAFATNRPDFSWPDGTLPYDISPEFDETQRDEIEAAIEHWNRLTIMRLVPRVTEADYVVFQPAAEACQSTVGRVGGEQFVSCAVGDTFDRGNVIHEIGHSVGFLHEHQRPDRDLFVEVNQDNIEPGEEDNFAIRTNGTTLGPYDYGSVMHYGRRVFAADDDVDTIIPLQDVEIGQRGGLSPLDVAGVCTLYAAPHFVVVWADDHVRNGSFDVWRAGLARWGKYCGRAHVLHADLDGDQRAPAVALDAERTSVVVWQHRPDSGNAQIRARRVAIDPADAFADLDVSGATGTNEHPAVAVRPNGEFVVVWQRRDDDGQRVLAAGFTRLGERRFEVTVADDAVGIPAGPQVGVSTDGTFVVVWAELVGEVLAVRASGFAEDGTDRFPTLTVADGLGDQDVFPRVAVSGNGTFVVVWEVGLSEVRARGLAADGSERFPEIPVNTEPAGRQRFADVAANFAGQFAVVWTDDRNENNIEQVRARVFDAAGVPLGADFTVNPRGGGEQRLPRVAFDSVGRMYVVWEDDEDRNGVFQIHAQVLDSSGEVVLDSFTVNTVWAGQQVTPAVAAR